MRTIAQLLLTAVVSSVCLAAPAPQRFVRQDDSGSSPTASVDSGVVVGIQTSVSGSPNLVNKYLGVPFAASPTRFAPAQTASPWPEPYQATQNGPACVQVSIFRLTSKTVSPYCFFSMKYLAQIMTDVHLAIQLSRSHPQLYNRGLQHPGST